MDNKLKRGQEHRGHCQWREKGEDGQYKNLVMGP